jgi:hypothetical protein
MPNESTDIIQRWYSNTDETESEGLLCSISKKGADFARKQSNCARIQNLFYKHIIERRVGMLQRFIIVIQLCFVIYWLMEIAHSLHYVTKGY